MTGEAYEIIKDVIKMLSKWEHEFRIIPDEYRVVVNRLNIYLHNNAQVKIPGNIRELIILLQTYSIEELEFDIGAEYCDMNLINQNGHVNPEIYYWYENSISKDDVDQNLIREFLLSCRKEFKETGNNRIVDMYAEARSFVNPSNYILTADKIVSLTSKYRNTSELIDTIKDWYEAAHITSDRIICCPVCGKVLSHDILKENQCTQMCMYYRDKYSLNLKEIKLDSKLKYHKLKKGIYVFTLIPAISELRILSNLEDQYGKENIRLYPDIDKFDISIEMNNRKILLDVKDFKSPYELVESLLKNNSFEKMNSNDDNEFVYLVIPEHRKYLFMSGNYKNIVKKKIQRHTNKIKVVYEDELYREVSGIFNEL